MNLPRSIATLACATALAVAALLPVGAGRAAGAGTDAAEAAAVYVSIVVDEALRDLTGEMEDSERERRVDGFLARHFDVPGLARFSLGVVWRRIGDPQRALYADAFSGFLVRLVAQGLARYRGEGVRVEPAREPRPDATETIVRGALDRPDKEALPIVWHLRDRDGQFVVTDVVVADLSLRILFREAAGSIAGSGPDGFARLVDLLERRALPGVAPQ